MSWTDAAVVVASLIVVTAALWLTQRLIPHPRRERHNDVAGFIFAAVAVMYAVPLAFVVIAVWGNNDAARQTTFKEANEVAGIYWIARQLPLPLGAQMEQDSLAYAHTVIDEEWPLMAQHKSSPDATALVYKIRADVFSFDPVDAQQQVLYEHLVTHVENLASERRGRLNETADGLPTLLWIVLIAGAVVTVGFTFLFGLSNTGAHAVMVLMLTTLVVISLISIKEMSFPFGGVTRVKPTAFEVFLTRLPPPR